MKMMTENKARTAVYLGLIVVAGAAAAYFAFGGGGPPPPDPKAQQRAAKIQASAPEPASQPPELPVSQRPPRGARPQAK